MLPHPCVSRGSTCQRCLLGMAPHGLCPAQPLTRGHSPTGILHVRPQRREARGLSDPQLHLPHPRGGSCLSGQRLGHSLQNGDAPLCPSPPVPAPAGKEPPEEQDSQHPRPAGDCPDLPTQPGHTLRAPQAASPHQANSSPLEWRHHLASSTSRRLPLIPLPLSYRRLPAQTHRGCPRPGRKPGSSNRPGRSALPPQTLTPAGEGLKRLEDAQRSAWRRRGESTELGAQVFPPSRQAAVTPPLLLRQQVETLDQPALPPHHHLSKGTPLSQSLPRKVARTTHSCMGKSLPRGKGRRAPSSPVWQWASVGIPLTHKRSSTARSQGVVLDFRILPPTRDERAELQ